MLRMTSHSTQTQRFDYSMEAKRWQLLLTVTEERGRLLSQSWRSQTF